MIIMKTWLIHVEFGKERTAQVVGVSKKSRYKESEAQIYGRY